MNKATKGALAAGAAALLLLGGAGSLALWSDTETVVGGSINTGTLDITGAPGVWTDLSNGGVGTPIPSIAAFRMVPGDVVSYRTTMKVTAIGDNLAADVSFVPTGGPLPTVAEGPDTAAIAATDIGTVTRNAAGFTITTTATDSVTNAPVTRITDADNGKTINVDAVVNFDAVDQVNVNTTVSFADFTITVQQVRV